jgi:hypothetical protein
MSTSLGSMVVILVLAHFENSQQRAVAATKHLVPFVAY